MTVEPFLIWIVEGRNEKFWISTVDTICCELLEEDEEMDTLLVDDWEDDDALDALPVEHWWMTQPQ